MNRLTQPRQSWARTAVRLLVLLVGLCACALGAWFSGRTGITRLLAAYGNSASVQAAVDEAVRLNPDDPEAHFARSVTLLEQGQHEDARTAIERAAALRPRDYRLWQELGYVRDLAGDPEGALIAYRNAVAQAPFYAQPRWQLGNLLLRLDRLPEAFAALARAAADDSGRLPNVVDLAWGAFEGDTRAIEAALAPRNDAWRLELARVFARHDKIAEARVLWRAVKRIPDGPRNRLVNELLTGKHFADAREVWESGQIRGANGATNPAVTDGGFEQPMKNDELGFGWRSLPSSPALRFVRDQTLPQSGQFSLRFDWNGNSDAMTPLVWQYVPVKPQQRYTLSFAVRTEELVSGALPEVALLDAESDGRAFSQTVLLARGTAGWQTHSLSFVTGEATQAVRLIIRRQDCAMLPCPIFGKTWFDDFVVTTTAQTISTSASAP